MTNCKEAAAQGCRINIINLLQCSDFWSLLQREDDDDDENDNDDNDDDDEYDDEDQNCHNLDNFKLGGPDFAW